MSKEDVMKSSPEANAAILKAWLYNLFAELEINKVIEAERRRSQDTVTLIIKFKN